MTVDVHVSWKNSSAEQDDWNLEGEYLSCGDNDGVIHVHTTEESLFVNAKEMASVHITGAVTS